MPSESLNGRVVAITGGARGIGLATAKALTAAGAKVAIGDLDAQLTKSAAESLGGSAVGTRLDVTDEASFKEFIATAKRELGPVDVLINNAGIMPIGPYLNETTATAQKILDINVLGYLTGMRLVLPGMLQRKSGHIVNIASIAGKSAVPGGITYAASKAAVVSMTESARLEYRGAGVSFTCVIPSFTNTDLVLGTKGTKGMKNVEPEDVAAAIVKAIRTGKKDVYIPGVLAGIVKSNAIFGRGVRDAVGRAIGADKTFLDVDQSQRASYESRITDSSG